MTETKPKSTGPSGKKSIKDVHAELGFTPLKDGQYETEAINKLSLDPELRAELDEYDLVARWINFKQYKTLGFHKAKWKPYKRISRPSNEAIYTINPDGFMIRDDLVLAVKPKEWNEAHKRYLRQRAEAQANTQKQGAEALKRNARQLGLDASIKEGYED